MLMRWTFDIICIAHDACQHHIWDLIRVLFFVFIIQIACHLTWIEKNTHTHNQAAAQTYRQQQQTQTQIHFLCECVCAVALAYALVVSAAARVHCVNEPFKLTIKIRAHSEVDGMYVRFTGWCTTIFWHVENERNWRKRSDVNAIATISIGAFNARNFTYANSFICNVFLPP